MVDFDDMSEESLRAAFKRKFGSSISEEKLIPVRVDTESEHLIINGKSVGMFFNYLDLSECNQDIFMTLWSTPSDYSFVLEDDGTEGQVLYIKKRC